MLKNLDTKLIRVIAVIAVVVFAIGGFVLWWVVSNWNNDGIVVDGVIGAGVYSSENSGNGITGDGVNSSGAINDGSTVNSTISGGATSDATNSKNSNSNGTNSNTIESVEGQDSYIFIHITGEVVNPGVVKIAKGERIVNAIEQAGGITSNADLSKINLAYVLNDGNMVIVPAYGESDENFRCVISGSGEYNDIDLANSSNSVENANSNIHLSTNIVNINTANQTELETLPGIGPSLAMRIISYRKQNGNFFKIEDLKNVSGIGESKFRELKDFVTVK